MSERDLIDEFRNLGKNIAQAFNAAWESDERKRFQDEMREGLSELGNTMKELGDQINDSEVVHKMKEDVEDLGERVHSGQVQDDARNSVISALQRVNAEIEKLINKWGADGSSNAAE